MFEGLKIKVIELSIVKKSKIFRLESEFYNSEQIVYKRSIKGEHAILYSQYGTSEELNEQNDGYPILRLNEFNSAFISIPSKYCNKIDHQIYESLQLKQNDVLICRTNGNPHLVGKSALVPKDYDYAFASYLFRVRPNFEFINSATLVTYLNSKFGRKEIEKYAMVGNQANFSPAKFKEIAIPLFSKQLMSQIEELTYLAFEYLESSIHTYQTAESFLNDFLNIQLKQFKSSNVKAKGQSYDISNRLDAEYYLPKYDDIIDTISQCQFGQNKIKNMYLLRDGNFVPNDDIQYKYIELSNIGVNGEITGCTYDFGVNLPSRARRIVHTGDIIVSSIEGSLQSCAIIPKEYDGALCSTGFYVLTPQTINAETSLVLFKSELVQSLFKRVCSGTILMSMNKDEFINIYIPVIDKDAQNHIADLIKECESLRCESKRLLELSKKAVETAIEQGEEIAIKILNV